MTDLFRRTGIFAGILWLVLSSGCGYRVGSIMHPQIKSIAIAPIKNETLEPFAAADMRQALAEQFQLDGSLEVKDMENADCILYGRIISVKNTGTTRDSVDNQQTYRAAEWNLQLTFEFVVLIPGQAKEFIHRRQVTGSASYQVLADHAVTRRRGVQQASREAAEDTVVYTVEAW